MSWQDQDNKKQRGKIDRIYVSTTEYYELNYYVDHYLESNGFEVSDKNRQTVSNAIDGYHGAIPIQRDALTDYLNKKFKK